MAEYCNDIRQLYAASIFDEQIILYDIDTGQLLPMIYSADGGGQRRRRSEANAGQRRSKEILELAKLQYVQKHYANGFQGKGNFVFCILGDKEPLQTVASRELTSETGKKSYRLYKCRKPVKQHYIYFHDKILGGPCYLKISSYLPFSCEFYFNGHNYIRLQLDQKGICYKMKDNAPLQIPQA